MREVESATPSFRCRLEKRSAWRFDRLRPCLFTAGSRDLLRQGGDSVCVSLTQVTDLGATDPSTGQALFRLSWKPPGQSGSSGTVAERVREIPWCGMESIAEQPVSDSNDDPVRHSILRFPQLRLAAGILGFHDPIPLRCQGESSIRSHRSGRRYAVCFPSRLAIGCDCFINRAHTLMIPGWPEILNRSIGQNVRTVGGMKL